MLARTKLFLLNYTQAVRFPKPIAFNPNVLEVMIIPDGKRRIVVPADIAWDDFFAEKGIELNAAPQTKKYRHAHR
jgi:antitoxin VapB